MRFVLVLPLAIPLIAAIGCQEKAASTKARVIVDTQETSADGTADDVMTGDDTLPDPVNVPETSNSPTTTGDSTTTNTPSPTTPGEGDASGTNTPPAGEYCYKATPEICEIEAAIVRETNKYRAEVGAPPLKFSVKMSFVARDWSQTQSSSGGISHNGFPSARFEAFIKEFGAKPSTSIFAMTGENVAKTNKKSGQTSEAIGIYVSQQWKGSSGHYKNMISKSFTSIGVGVYILNGKSVYSTQIFGKDVDALPPP